MLSRFEIAVLSVRGRFTAIGSECFRIGNTFGRIHICRHMRRMCCHIVHKVLRTYLAAINEVGRVAHDPVAAQPCDARVHYFHILGIILVQQLVQLPSPKQGTGRVQGPEFGKLCVGATKFLGGCLTGDRNACIKKSNSLQRTDNSTNSTHRASRYARQDCAQSR